MTLSSRMPDLKALELLLAIARTGSLGAAGRQFHMSQQTVSTRLSALEAMTGVVLVIRSARGSYLTQAGIVVSEWAEQLLAQAERFDTSLLMLRSDAHSRLRIAASLTVAEQLMPRWLVSMHTERRRRGEVCQEVILRAMNSHAVTEVLRAMEADIGFIEAPDVPHDLQNKIVARDELVLVVDPSHQWARRRAPISAGELMNTSLVSREPKSGARDYFIAALKRRFGDAADPAPPVLELSSVTAIRAAVAAGAAPAVLSRLSVADDVEAGRLCTVKVEDLDLTRKIRAVWLGDRTPPAGAVRELLNHIGRQRFPGRGHDPARA